MNLGVARRARSELNVQLSEATKSRVISPLQGVLQEHRVLQAVQENIKCDLPFHTRQRRSETKVSGPPECKMTVVRSHQIEQVGIREALGIAIGRGKNDHHT